MVRNQNYQLNSPAERTTVSQSVSNTAQRRRDSAHGSVPMWVIMRAYISFQFMVKCERMNRSTIQSILLVSIVLLLVIGMTAGPLAALTASDSVVAAQEQEEEGPEIDMMADIESSGIFVHTDYAGGAGFVVGVNYHLDSDEERERFEELADNPAVEADMAELFAEDMHEVATETDGVEPDDLQQPGASIELTDDGSVGMINVWIEWAELLAVEDDELVMAEPFASGFGPDSAALQNAGLPAEEEEYVGVEPTPVENLVVWVPSRGDDQFSSVNPDPVETADEGHVIGLDMSDGFDADFEIRVDPADEAEIGPDAAAESDEDGFSLDSPGQTGTYIAWTMTAIVVATVVGIVAVGVKRYRD